jgi:CO/xanthine dehydrogenase FAD-binding subunit
VEAVVPEPAGNCGAGLARVCRTPRDRPIVNAVALVQCGRGSSAHRVRVAVGGVGPTPVIWTATPSTAAALPVESLLADGIAFPSSAQTPDDFRGSAEYRRAQATIVARRALQEAWEVARAD